MDDRKALTMPFASPIDISKEELRKLRNLIIFDRYFYFPANIGHIKIILES